MEMDLVGIKNQNEYYTNHYFTSIFKDNAGDYELMKIRCVVDRITYQNQENGYTILKCRVKEYVELVPVIGNLLDANMGSVLLMEGNFTRHSLWNGKAFRMLFLEIIQGLCVKLIAFKMY